jgi:hypothetical protein
MWASVFFSSADNKGIEFIIPICKETTLREGVDAPRSKTIHFRKKDL